MSYTIKYLKSLSDKELSVLVTMKLNNCSEWCLSDDESCFYHCGIDGDGWFEIPVIDINSWADMGPLIKHEKIMILLDPLSTWFATCEFNQLLNSIPYYNENPLRAAAVVYLLID